MGRGVQKALSMGLQRKGSMRDSIKLLLVCLTKYSRKREEERARTRENGVDGAREEINAKMCEARQIACGVSEEIEEGAEIEEAEHVVGGGVSDGQGANGVRVESTEGALEGLIGIEEHQTLAQPVHLRQVGHSNGTQQGGQGGQRGQGGQGGHSLLSLACLRS